MAISNNGDALENILGAENKLQPPHSRINRILQNILGGTCEIETPVSNNGQLLKQILDEHLVPEDDVYAAILVANFGS